ncbi:MAG: hypothetical protein EPO42_01140, partial [Gallionellaceae bacterium]
SLDIGLHQSDAVREKLVCGTVEEGRIMNLLRCTDYRGKVNSSASLTVILFVRLVLFGFFMSILIKRFNRR